MQIVWKDSIIKDIIENNSNFYYNKEKRHQITLHINSLHVKGNQGKNHVQTIYLNVCFFAKLFTDL